LEAGQSSERPYQDYSEMDLYETLHQFEKDYEAADRERERVINAYGGGGAVLEDEDYRSATERRMRIDHEISEIDHERQTRRQEHRERREH
jgi:hypothetical protein